MEDHTIHLSTKPGAALCISVSPADPAEGSELSNTLVVFLNGLGLPRASWTDTAQHLAEMRGRAGRPVPAMLRYDRFGQGDSDPDPTDPPDTPYGHDAAAVVADLHQLLVQVARDYLGTRPVEDLRLVLVGNSIGCPLARLYAAAHPGTVQGLLLLDSMMANSDYVSLFPDPDALGFDPAAELAEGVSADDLRHARTMIAKFFHPTTPNAEHFDRRDMAKTLPYAHRPALPAGPNGKSPRLIVLGHDWDFFAEQNEKAGSPSCCYLPLKYLPLTQEVRARWRYPSSPSTPT